MDGQGWSSMVKVGPGKPRFGCPGFKYASGMLRVCFKYASSIVQECFKHASSSRMDQEVSFKLSQLLSPDEGLVTLNLG